MSPQKFLTKLMMFILSNVTWNILPFLNGMSECLWKFECYNKKSCFGLTVFGLQKMTLSSNFYYNFKGFFFYHYWFSTLPRHTRNRQISCTPNFSLVTFLLITENTGNSFCGTYLRLSLCVLYSSSVFGGKLRTLRNVSRILAVVDESDAVLFHTDIISSYERLKNVT